jgi:hypothetical protein
MLNAIIISLSSQKTTSRSKEPMMIKIANRMFEFISANSKDQNFDEENVKDSCIRALFSTIKCEMKEKSKSTVTKKPANDPVHRSTSLKEQPPISKDKKATEDLTDKMRATLFKLFIDFVEVRVDSFKN